MASEGFKANIHWRRQQQKQELLLMLVLRQPVVSGDMFAQVSFLLPLVFAPPVSIFAATLGVGTASSVLPPSVLCGQCKFHLLPLSVLHRQFIFCWLLCYVVTASFICLRRFPFFHFLRPRCCSPLIYHY